MVAATDPKTRLFTTEEYDRMIAAGIFVGDRRVELLAGEIVEHSTISPANANAVMSLSYLFFRHLPDELRTAVRVPFQLDLMSEPEPDLMVYRPRERTGHLLPDDLLLVIEVADSTLDYDRNRKFPRYAAAGIPEAWLFDVAARILERHTEPLAGYYRRRESARAGDSLSSTTVPNLTLAVDAILAPEKAN